MMLTPEHWRERAAHARTIAQFMRDPEGQRLLLEIASLYDKLAERVRLALHDVPG